MTQSQKAQLEQYVRSVAGDDPDISSKLLDIFGSKPDAAQRFTDGFLRQSDYTRKTEETANLRKQAETLVSDYENRLTEAEERIKATMKAAADDKISAATANAQLEHIKQAYGLKDDDIPSSADVRKTIQSGKDSSGPSIDIDAKLKEFEDGFMKRLTDKLLPEMSGMAALPVIWNTISREHFELTGKHLTEDEQIALLKEAREKNTSLKSVWEKNNNIPDLRLSKRDEENKRKWRDEFEKEQIAKQSEAVLSGVKRNGVEIVPDTQRSPLLRQREQLSKGRDAAFEPKQGDKPDPASTGDQFMTGADRAAARFLDRRAKGIPWGGKETDKSTAA